MRNTYRIIWSDEALKNLKNIIEYLEGYWSEPEIRSFAKLLDKHLNLLQENPFLFPKDSKYFNLRKAVISKQSSIYYRISQNQIHIISIFDNRQNPERLKST